MANQLILALQAENPYSSILYYSGILVLLLDFRIHEAAIHMS